MGIRRAIVASLAVHALLALALLIPHILPSPKSPIEIEILPYKKPLDPPKPPPPEPPKKPDEPPRPKRPKTSPGVPTKKGEGDRPKAPEAMPTPPTKDLRQFAPSNVNLVLVLRCDRVRESPHAEFTEAVLAALPDYQTFLGGTGLSAVKDFDALLVASADPSLVVETFLAARGRAGTPLERLAQKPLMRGDPRVVKIVHDGLAVLGKPEAMEPSDLGTSNETQWLGHLDKILDQKDAPALSVNVSDLHKLIRVANFPTPHAVELAMTADAAPALRLVATFGSDEEAAQFVAVWPKLIEAYRQQTRFLGIGALFDQLVVKSDGVHAEVTGVLPAMQTKLAFSWLRGLLPKRADGVDLHPPPPSDGGAAHDLGTADLRP